VNSKGGKLFGIRAYLSLDIHEEFDLSFGVPDSCSWTPQCEALT